MTHKAMMVIDDEPGWRSAEVSLLRPHGVDLVLTTNVTEARRLLEQRPFHLVAVADQPPVWDGLKLLQEIKAASPATPVLLLARRASVERAVEAIKGGALDYFVRPLNLQRLEETLHLVAANGNGYRRSAGGTPSETGGRLNKQRAIICRDPVMQKLLHTARRVAASNATVLIQGESGTGKELLARYIHAHGDRADGPFVAINCASLPEGLLESELFGHEKGAFTGAFMRKLGKFELAHQGTILLDEISEMHPQLQAKLLRVLQEGEIDRVGGRQPIAINVRVIATTNRDLPATIEKGEFREDLFYRLNVINLTLPPLRQRPSDIPLLAEYFLNKYGHAAQRTSLRFSPAALAMLHQAPWKGNVRELENTIARGVLLAQTEMIMPEDLLPSATTAVPELAPEADPVSPLSIRDMERRMIFKALDETSGNRTHAAKILGISVRTLRNKLNEYKVNYL